MPAFPRSLQTPSEQNPELLGVRADLSDNVWYASIDLLTSILHLRDFAVDLDYEANGHEQDDQYVPEGTLLPSVDLAAWAKGSDETLDVTINGLFVSHDHTAYDRDQPNITGITIRDDAVYGVPVEITLTETPDAFWVAEVEIDGENVFVPAHAPTPEAYTEATLTALGMFSNILDANNLTDS